MSLEDLIEQKVMEKLALNQPHKCHTCDYGKIPEDIPLDLPFPIAPLCTFEGAITVVNNQCQNWQPAQKKPKTPPVPKPKLNMEPLPPLEKDHDGWERFRATERFTFGLDVGAGTHKLLPMGLDIRPVTDVQADAVDIPFPNKNFVIVTLRGVLEHVRDWQKALAEAERVALDVYVFHPKPESWDGEFGDWFPLPDNYKPIKEYQYTTLYKKVT